MLLVSALASSCGSTARRPPPHFSQQQSAQLTLFARQAVHDAGDGCALQNDINSLRSAAVGVAPLLRARLLAGIDALAADAPACAPPPAPASKHDHPKPPKHDHGHGHDHHD